MLCCVAYPNTNFRGDNARYFDEKTASGDTSSNLQSLTAMSAFGICPSSQRLTWESFTPSSLAISAGFMPAFSIAFRNALLDFGIVLNYRSYLRRCKRKILQTCKFFSAASWSSDKLVRYFRTRKGLRFYAVKDGPQENLSRLALTSLKQSGVGQLVRIQLSQTTITDELQPVKPKELPISWREAFERYWWRLRS